MSQDRREKIQARLLVRIEELIAQYDVDKDTSSVEDNLNVLQGIINLLAAVGYPGRELTVGMYAAPAQTPPPPQEPPA
jgi:hypothetical protein